ncbi:MAG: helix-turn-helix transcriptional regulator [Ruminococcaceae bacterium]|nr:helix-turn-helix transcriptional regulator [Oscillospiraceae bacterium]
MSFADNLKQLRKERQLSQEELAEMLDVSRQAISKWEQGLGYPEAEKLLLLSGKLNISLDSLMSTEIVQTSGSASGNVTGTIVITSPHENVIATCYKVSSSGKMSGGKSSPQYALYGVSNGTLSFWGEPTTFLGWYANKELISKEISEIYSAIQNGVATYTLKYSAKTERKWMRIKIIE